MRPEDTSTELAASSGATAEAEPGLALGHEEQVFPTFLDEVKQRRVLGLASTSHADFESEAAIVREALDATEDGEPMLEQQTLVDRLVNVLRLACAHLTRLHEYRGHWADSEDPLLTLADKIIVESAILVLIAARCAGEWTQVSRWVNRLALSLAPQVRSIRNEILIRRHPQAAMSLGVGHAALSSIGVVDARFDRLLRDALGSELADCTERLPYREMERRWLSGLIGLDSRPRFDDLLPLSIAFRPTHPIYMLATDVYALTHVPMFVTDFGRIPPPSDFPHDRCRDSLDAAAAWVLYTDNFDLMGELVLAPVLLNAPWTPSQLLAWKTLEYAQDRLGFLASPSFAIKQFHELPAEEKTSYAFRHVYHTTYVAGMLYALLLRNPSPMMNVPTPLSVTDATLREECRSAFRAAMAFCAKDIDNSRYDIDTLAKVTTAGQSDPPLEAVRRLVSLWASRDPGASMIVLHLIDQIDLPAASLASSLADGLLSCSARAYDLPILSQTLRLVANLGLPLTPTVAAAARFLIRQQLPTGAIGSWFLAPENAAEPRAPEVTAGLASSLAALSLSLGRDGHEGM